jgi:hypothetical protein
MASVSVILPTSDRPTLLPRAVESLLAQTGVDLEVIIIDSNRTCVPVIRQHRGAQWLNDQRVRIFRPDRVQNAAAARNAGLGAARGEWVSYLDDDDVYRPQKLARQIELAARHALPVVLCGAEFVLRGRRRIVQCDAATWQRDELILRARWNTPLLLHRHPGSDRFDETLSPGEDAEFAHRLLAKANADSVAIVPEPLVEIHPQPGPRVNTHAAPVRIAAARILALRPRFYSRSARRRYVLQTLLARAKLGRKPGECAVLGWSLLRESHGADWRACANAMAMSLGVWPGRWVS